MPDSLYLSQLEKYYREYLTGIIAEKPFDPLVLRGGKNKPGSTVELHEQIRLFQKNEKSEASKGWTIEWSEWFSKKFGNQKWPSSIIVSSEEDYLFLTKKASEVDNFKRQLHQLISWRQEMRTFLLERPQFVLEFAQQWDKICVVTDYLIAHDVQDNFIRSLPVPVHTKFIGAYQHIILALLRHLCPERMYAESGNLETALKLKKKQVIFPLRFLDPTLDKYTGGMNIIGVTPDALRSANWPVSVVWLVENETNLYLLPQRVGAMVLFSKGNATNLLADIPIFRRTKLYYWGDLDEDGFVMLHRMRKHYPNIQSVFMDIETVNFHSSEIGEQPHKYKVKSLELLTQNEQFALSKLSEIQGRIEQEKLQQKYLSDILNRL